MNEARVSTWPSILGYARVPDLNETDAASWRRPHRPGGDPPGAICWN
jgi:hypothetical protein